MDVFFHVKPFTLSRLQFLPFFRFSAVFNKSCLCDGISLLLWILQSSHSQGCISFFFCVSGNWTLTPVKSWFVDTILCWIDYNNDQ